ncbi:MAG: D-2-hydroxyacid dehydrogenase [Afipia sp.]|nr:D-2-hydroxyacid dehydrogenase [Afipia sp.]
MTKTPSILVYSKYQQDLPRFRKVLSHSLSDVRIEYANTPEEAKEFFASTTILYGWGFPPEWLREIPNLAWVQKMGAGVDDIVPNWPTDRQIILTRTDGKLIAPRMAEYVLAMILDHNLRLDHARAQQVSRTWAFFEMGALSDLTVGIAGLGEIGSEVAKTLRLNNCKVIGWRRSESRCDAVQKQYVGLDQIGNFVTKCDVVVLVLPLTSSTRRLFNKKVFDKFKSGCHLINVGRGGVIDEPDLLTAIDGGAVARASLDVFDKEPLPAAHSFWGHPKITITPHVCGPLIPEDVAPHFVANVRAFMANRDLANHVDLGRQY